MNHLRGIAYAFLALICLTSTDVFAQTQTSGKVYTVESVTKTGAGKAADLTWKDGTKQVNLLQFGAGKVVFLNFWATWCPPCIRSIPEAKSIWNTYKNKNFVLLGISLDKDLDTWKDYVKEQQMSWMQVADGNFWDNKAAMLYGIGSIPSVWILDQNGNIALKDVNPLSEGEAIRAKITELLNKK